MISYKLGFVPNGLLGSIILKLKEIFDLKTTTLISVIYLSLHTVNVGIFLILIKNFIRANFLIGAFLILHPILIVFPLYDIGALFRKEAFIIFLLLFHFFISNIFLKKKISKHSYQCLVILVIIPGIILNCLIYNLQFFLIPVHILIIDNNLAISRQKKIFLLIFFILFFFLIDYLKINTGYEYLYNITQSLIENEQEVLAAPFLWLKNNLISSILLTIKEIDNWKVLHNVNLITNYSLALFILIIPIFFIYLQLNFKSKPTHLYKILITLVPMLGLFFLGIDWGRWLHIIFITLIMYFSQFKFDVIIISKKCYYIFGSLILIYITSFGIPHCCAKSIFFFGFWKNINFILNYI